MNFNVEFLGVGAALFWLCFKDKGRGDKTLFIGWILLAASLMPDIVIAAAMALKVPESPIIVALSRYLSQPLLAGAVFCIGKYFYKRRNISGGSDQL